MIRRILALILSKSSYKEIEEESKKWYLVCGKCGHSVSVWDAGGIRAGAASKKKKVLGRCPGCRRCGLLDVIRKITSTKPQ